MNRLATAIARRIAALPFIEGLRILDSMRRRDVVLGKAPTTPETSLRSAGQQRPRVATAPPNRAYSSISTDDSYEYAVGTL